MILNLQRDLNLIQCIYYMSQNDLVHQSILKLHEQSKSAWQAVNDLVFSAPKINIANIVVAGMGGSTLGAHLLRSALEKYISVPLVIVNDYQLPQYVNSHTLVIVSSYSGNTEETVSALNDAVAKNAQIFVMASGGKLLDLAKTKNLLHYEIDETANPSKQPRYGLGYGIFGILTLLIKLKLISLKNEEVENILEQIADTEQGIGESFSKFDPKKIAKSLKNKIPIVVAGEFLVGNAHILQNQFNESSKTFAAYFILPELNHHLLEALNKPKKLSKKIHFLFLTSSLYSQKLSNRVKNTATILQKFNIGYTMIEATERDQFLAALNMIAGGGLLSLELAKQNKVDPSPVPVVEMFKKMLQ